MEPIEARGTLDQIEALAGRTRGHLLNAWQTAALWALLSLGSVPLAAQVNGDRFVATVNGYWVVAVPAGAVASYVLHRRRMLRTSPAMTPALIALAVLVLTPLGALLALGAVSAMSIGTGGFLAAAFTALVLSWIARNKPVAITSALLVALAVGSWSFTSYAPIVLASVFCAVYGGTALYQRRREHIAA